VRCVAIRFWARYEPALQTDYDIEIIKPPPDKDGQYILQLTLLCNHEIDVGEVGDPSKPPRDTGEQLPEQLSLTRGKRRGSAKKKGSKKKQKRV
jgi:hypothetical protein